MDYVGAIIIIALLGVTAWALLSVGKSDLQVRPAPAQGFEQAAAQPPAVEPEPPAVAEEPVAEAANAPSPSDPPPEEGLDALDEDESDMETVQASPEELKKILESVGTSGEE